jgi:hypothetical protein
LGPTSASHLAHRPTIRLNAAPLQAKELPHADLEAAVQSALRAQLAGAGAALHTALTGAGDPAPAAAALQAAAAQLGAGAGAASCGPAGSVHDAAAVGQQQRQQHAREEGPEGADSSGRGGGLSSLGNAGGGASGGGGGGGGDSGGGSPALLSQARAAELLRERLGYSLEVRPSSIPHNEAGAAVGRVPFERF